MHTETLRRSLVAQVLRICGFSSAEPVLSPGEGSLPFPQEISWKFMESLFVTTTHNLPTTPIRRSLGG